MTFVKFRTLISSSQWPIEEQLLNESGERERIRRQKERFGPIFTGP
jgi:hypothetical protein